MTDDALPEADRVEGAPHPRETARLFGHGDVEADVLAALTAGRLHHAWLLTGPEGVGKATLAWRIARHLLAQSRVPAEAGLFGDAPTAPATLDIAPDHPVARRVAALSEPGLLLIRRTWDQDRKRLKSQITVDEVRRLNSFFGLSAAEGGRRVVIVDSADEMNVNAANALLKVLEEPPKDAVLILVSHRPSRLLPTIRSRCRELRLSALSPDALAEALVQAGITTDGIPELSELSGGSAGEAIRLVAQDGLALYARLVTLFGSCPRMDRQQATALAEFATARGADERLPLFVRLLDLALVRLARTGAGQPPRNEASKGEAETFGRLSPDVRAAQAWAALQQELGARIGHGLGVNIDPQSLLLDAFLRIDDTARNLARS